MSRERSYQRLFGIVAPKFKCKGIPKSRGQQEPSLEDDQIQFKKIS